jgi:hypothetical protein
LISALCSSKTRKVQVDLFNKELGDNAWKVLGFISSSLLDLDVEVWTVELTREQIDLCYAEWEKAKHYD